MADNQNKWEGTNPWLGLQTYQEGTRLWGRDAEITMLTDIVCNNLATVVFGKSGIGKSSLIHAGISPEIRKRGMMPIYIRLDHNTEISYTNQIERAVSGLLDKDDKLGDEYPSAGLWDFFHRHVFYSKEGHSEVLPVVIIDQFEEIYTIADAEHKHQAQELFEEFADLLNNKKPEKVISTENDAKRFTKSEIDVNGGDIMTFRIHSERRLNYIEESKFHVVVCLREDYLYYLERNTSKIPSFKVNRYSLQALDRESAKEVIIKPRPGLFSDIEAGDIISKISTFNDEGKEEIDPTILSIFLFKYFNKKGNVNTDNIINEFYKDETKNISDTSLAYLEDHLISGEGFRHFIPYNDALSNGVTKQELDKLISCRILTVEPRKGHKYLEFSHDVICPIASANREHRQVKEQTKRLKKRILVVTVLFVFALFLIGSFAYLNQQVKNVQIQNASIKAHFMIVQGDVLNAVKLLLNIVPDKKVDISVKPVTESVLNEAYDSLNSSYACISILQHNDDVSTAEYSEDSKLIVTACSDGICRIWNALSGELKKELNCNLGGMKSVSFNNEANKVVMSFDNGSIQIWDLSTEQVVSEFKHRAAVNYACFSPDGKYIVSASKDSTVRLWDAINGKQLDVIVKHSDDVNCAVFSSDGSRVITSSEDGSSVVYDLNSKTSRAIFANDTSSVEYAEFNYDDTKIVVVTSYSLFLLNGESYSLETVLNKCHDDLITAASFCPDGKTVVTSSYDKTIKIWNVVSGDLIHTYKGHSNIVKDVVFSPDGKYVLSTSSDNEARVWNTTIDKEIINSGMQTISSATYSPSGEYVAAISSRGTVKIWDAHSKSLIKEFKIDNNKGRQDNSCNSIVFNDGSDKVVIATDNNIMVYDLFYNNNIDTISDVGCNYAFFADNDNIIALSREDTTKQYQLNKKNTVYTFSKLGYNNLSCLSYTRDGKTCLISYSSNDSTRFSILNLKDLKVLNYCNGHSKKICSLKSSNDSKRIISSSSDNIAIIWDFGGGIIHKLKGHSQEVFFSEFSKDDNYCLTASTDRTIKIWNTMTGKNIATKSSSSSPTYTYMFSPTERKYIIVDKESHEDVIIFNDYFCPSDLVLDLRKRFDDYKLTKEQRDLFLYLHE